MYIKEKRRTNTGINFSLTEGIKAQLVTWVENLCC